VHRVWDVHNKMEINKLEFPASVADIELSSDGKLLTAAYANKVAFWNVDTSVCCCSCFVLVLQMILFQFVDVLACMLIQSVAVHCNILRGDA